MPDKQPITFAVFKKRWRGPEWPHENGPLWDDNDNFGRPTGSFAQVAENERQRCADELESLEQRVRKLRDEWERQGNGISTVKGGREESARKILLGCAKALTALLEDILGSTGTGKDGDAK